MLSSIRKLFVVAVALAALVPAGAGAMVIRDSPEAAISSPLNTGAAGQGDAGFQWGDAAIGAAGTLALLAAGGFAVRSARRRAGRRGFAAG